MMVSKQRFFERSDDMLTPSLSPSIRIFFSATILPV